MPRFASIVRFHPRAYWIVAASMLALLAGYAMHPAGVHASSEESRTGHSIEQVVEKWRQYRPAYAGNPYAEQPGLYPPYRTGKLDSDYLQDGIHTINFMRFLAGMPENAMLDEALNDQAMQSVIRNAVADLKSAGQSMPDLPAALGQQAGSGNIGYLTFNVTNPMLGLPSLQEAVSGTIRDTSSLERLSGKRNTFLAPERTRFGFGFAFTPSLHYRSIAFNTPADSGAADYDYIAWPGAGAFPLSEMSEYDGWTVRLNPNKYGNLSASQVKVTLQRINDNKTWSFSAADQGKQGDRASKFFAVDSASGSITFRPDQLMFLNDYDVYKVHISGIRDNGGSEKTISYEVRFFDLPPDGMTKEYIADWKSRSGKPAGSDRKVRFANKEFEAAIRLMLNKPEDDVTEAEMARIRFLELMDDPGKDAALLAKLTHLRTLFLFDDLSDYSFLKQTKYLQRVEYQSWTSEKSGLIDAVETTPLPYMDNFQIYTPVRIGSIDKLISHIPNVRTLTLESGDIDSLQPLLPLHRQLKRLTVNGENLTDISALDRFQLQELRLESAKMKDVSAHIAKQKRLNVLRVSYSGINDLSFASSLPGLMSLDISGNRISDLSPLAALPNLAELYAVQNRIKDISVLKQLKHLNTVNVSYNGMDAGASKAAADIAVELRERGVYFEDQPQS
ncbi:leucine-rich repeat domain-containing protein [Paenibacillus sp. MSJ-34]|uniref:leucine-rich repeat domain-containing protein n=1 Tax=Paenibacillus sp. MSJ-34 TaxID=2841529 RepID=UPI001C11EAE3|nr:leucine-rich repeat domain-containing protein [Paenibacillus sp. MSJ-34]MBU5441494.1 hypothetical protein [Paenibacillus sp. MSJ-34]